jgi:hypothetical protein
LRKWVAVVSRLGSSLAQAQNDDMAAPMLLMRGKPRSIFFCALPALQA